MTGREAVSWPGGSLLPDHGQEQRFLTLEGLRSSLIYLRQGTRDRLLSASLDIAEAARTAITRLIGASDWRRKEYFAAPALRSQLAWFDASAVSASPMHLLRTSLRPS